MKQVILSTAYLGPVSYFVAMVHSSNVLIEQYDSYHKQTYRNRCRILAANGPLDLVIPVVKNSGEKTMVKDVKIDYSTRWQANHWRSLFSAYNSSPFFEYYADALEPFYATRRAFLIDFNTELMQTIIDLLQIEVELGFTANFDKEYSGQLDYREVISPKKRDGMADQSDGFIPYTQTFSEKYGFISDLSIADLLFNCGSDSERILIESPMNCKLDSGNK